MAGDDICKEHADFFYSSTRGDGVKFSDSLKTMIFIQIGKSGQNERFDIANSESSLKKFWMKRFNKNIKCSFGIFKDKIAFVVPELFYNLKRAC